jgi:hypothetical protein
MTNSIESKGSRIVAGLLRGALPASILTSGILLAYGYATGLIYSVGDPRQLTSIFGGIIFGTIVFALLGFALKPNRMNLLSLTILSTVLLIAGYSIIFLNSFALNNTNIMIVAFLISSPAMAVSQLVGRFIHGLSLLLRLSMGAVQALLVIVFVFVYALEYEVQGQLNLYLGPLIFLLASVVYFIVIKLV